MIISASRRCDIPAFYSDWFLNRIKQGYVNVKNPFNANQIKTVSLKKEDVDCIVFWTKNVSPIMDKLDILNNMGYIYYFLYTITPYECDIEPYVPCKSEIADSFRMLSEKIGKHRNILRYDPIIINDKYTENYHIETFEKFLIGLKGYTNKCIISFVDIYKKLPKASKMTIGEEIERSTMQNIAKHFAKTAKENNIEIQTCSEDIDLSGLGIYKKACIDKDFIEQLKGSKLDIKKAASQRKLCSCAQSTDIGVYNCCPHGCIYCYANSGQEKVFRNIKRHNVYSPILIDD